MNQRIKKYSLLATQLASYALGLVVTAVWLSAAQAQHDDATLAGQLRWIEERSGRATIEDGQIVAVDLRHAWLTDDDLVELAKLSALKSIDLSYTKVTDLGLEHLKPLEQVQQLELFFAESVSDAGVAHIKHWRKLKRLNLRGTKVTSTVLEHLAGAPQLEWLDIGFSRVNDDYFEQLSELPRLTSLNIGGNKMSGVALPLLKLVPTLRELDLSGQQRTDSGLWSVAVTDANCQQLSQLVQLRSLRLADSSLSDRGLSLLSNLSELESLDLTRTRITARGLKAISGLKQLRELNLRGCGQVDDEAYRTLAAFPALQYLYLAETKVSLKALQQTARPQSWERLYLGEVQFSPSELAELREGLAPVKVISYPALTQTAP